MNVKKLFLLNLPYLLFVYPFDKLAQAFRLAPGSDLSGKLLSIGDGFTAALSSPWLSFHPTDLLIGIAGAVILRMAVYLKGKNAKKYRHGIEYGSARWGTAADIAPYMDKNFFQNIPMTQTERITMASRPKQPKYARNKNILVIGGSGSGKTRFFCKPSLLQAHSSYVCTDPKGTLLPEIGSFLERKKYRIKCLNLINFRKSMKYNPLAYIRSEKDILKLVNALIMNTKGEGEKSSEDFWVKAERLYYSALIGYIWYEAPEEEKNFITLLDLINASEAREDDETYQSPVDLLFSQLEERKPDHFAVKQYRKFKMAAGKTLKSILISCGARLAPFDIKELRDLMEYDELELDTLGDQKTALFVILSDTDSTFNFVAALMYMSRFGRDYLQVGMYTEIMFPEHDVHFIAVNDGVDSTQGDNEFTPFRNIINEWYAKDTSKKIRAVMKVKGNAGEHLTTNAPYGYMKDPDDSKHWIPDREAADVVYEIGLYVMDGFGPSQIARKLRERKILTPAAYYESKGIPCNVKKQGDPYGWDNTTIAGIMDRWREYLGHTVNFKTTKKSYKSKKKIKNPESEWVIFENTHEPIWTEAIAEAVKQARQSRRRPTKMGEMGMFSGMMYCADCGSILYQCRATGFRKDQEYYICSGYRKGKQVCGTPHSIRTVILEELILQNLREIVSFARSHENRFVQMVMDMDIKERNKGLAKKRKLLSEGEKRITELDMIFKRLYEDNISGKLTDERFHKLSTDYEAEQAGLQTQAAILREEIEEAEGKSANVDRFLSVVRQYTDIPELTPRILHEFVEKIIIHAATDPHSKINRRQEVDIYYKGIGILEMSKVFDSRQK